jgi:hypothetical protein
VFAGVISTRRSVWGLFNAARSAAVHLPTKKAVPKRRCQVFAGMIYSGRRAYLKENVTEHVFAKVFAGSISKGKSHGRRMWKSVGTVDLWKRIPWSPSECAHGVGKSPIEECSPGLLSPTHREDNLKENANGNCERTIESRADLLWRTEKEAKVTLSPRGKSPVGKTCNDLPRQVFAGVISIEKWSANI